MELIKSKELHSKLNKWTKYFSFRWKEENSFVNEGEEYEVSDEEEDTLYIDQLVIPTPLEDEENLSSEEFLMKRREYILNLSNAYQREIQQLRTSISKRQQIQLKKQIQHLNEISPLSSLNQKIQEKQKMLRESANENFHQLNQLSFEKKLDKCKFEGCSLPNLLLSPYCYARMWKRKIVYFDKHILFTFFFHSDILNDPNQTLFIPCTFKRLDGQQCNFPVLVGSDPPYCYCHLEVSSSKERRHKDKFLVFSVDQIPKKGKPRKPKTEEQQLPLPETVSLNSIQLSDSNAVTPPPTKKPKKEKPHRRSKQFPPVSPNLPLLPPTSHSSNLSHLLVPFPPQTNTLPPEFKPQQT